MFITDSTGTTVHLPHVFPQTAIFNDTDLAELNAEVTRLQDKITARRRQQRRERLASVVAKARAPFEYAGAYIAVGREIRALGKMAKPAKHVAKHSLKRSA